MPHHSFYKDVFPYWGTDLKDFVFYYYIMLNKSDVEIINMINSRTGVKFTRTTLSNWHKRTGISSRSPHDRFTLAIRKGNFNHKKIAQKIDYLKRTKKIDYGAISRKRRDKLIGRNYLRSRYATKLLELFNATGKTKKGLARYLDVSPHTVGAWCSKKNKIHPIYWKPLKKFFNLEQKDIFKR